MTQPIYLITGGAGFVGSTIAIKLKACRENIHVIALDNLKRRGAELNLPRLEKHGVEFIHGDIRNREDLDQVGEVHHIIECSAEASVLAGYQDASQYVVNTNLMGTINCLELARKHQADFIFLSTSRVYPINLVNKIAYKETDTRYTISPEQSLAGVSRHGISEIFPLLQSRSLYGATKLCSELMILEYMDMYNIKAVINRCGLIAGPWQMGKIDQGVIALWAAKHVYNGNLKYIGFNGEGKQVRDVLHIDDLFLLINKQLDQTTLSRENIFNVGGGVENSISLKELTVLCQDYTGNRINIGKEHETRPGDIRIYITDNHLVSKAFDWKPQKTCPETVQQTCDWVIRHKDLLQPILN